MFNVRAISINGGSVRVTEDDANRTDTFYGIPLVKKRVPVLLHGISSYRQVRVTEVNTGHVALLGFRAGPNGTGECWIWREPDLRDRIAEQDDDAHFRGDDDI